MNVTFLALMMALKLNEKLLTQQVVETIPYKESKFIKCTNDFVSMICCLMNIIFYFLFLQLN